MKQSMYSQQLARARKQSPAADAAQPDGVAPPQSVFSDVTALKAAPAPVAAAPQATGLGDDWLVAEPQVEIPDDGLGHSWMPASSDTPDDDDPVMTAWREDDPEMAAWDLDEDTEILDPIAVNGDASEADPPSPDMAIPTDNDLPDDDLDDEESDELPPSWL